MIEFALLAVPGYLLIGVIVIAAAIWLSPPDERPDFGDAVSILLVGMVCWPMLLWAFFHEEDGE